MSGAGEPPDIQQKEHTDINSVTASKPSCGTILMKEVLEVFLRRYDYQENTS